MIRDILFKAKRIDNGEWTEGYYSKFPHPFSGTIEDFIFSPYYDEEKKCGYENNYQVNPETICQYTGLPAYWLAFEDEPQECDVWEHDLLEVDYNGKTVIAEVKYEGGMFILASNEFANSYIPLFDVVQVEDVYWVDAKVVGNIFDNPELLEVLS